MNEIPGDVREAGKAVAGQIEEFLLTYDADGSAALIQPDATDLIARAIMAERARWQGQHPVPGAVTVTLEPRPDGGLRVWSASDPGLILSGRDVDAVLSDILPAVQVLREHNYDITKETVK